MKLEGERESSNIEDRRGIGGVGGGIGIGTVALALIAWYFGIDPSVVLQGAQVVQQQQAPHSAPRDPNAPKDAAFAKLCASAEVLVLRSRIGPGQACPSATVFVKEDFDRGGSVELWRQGQAWRLRWAATERGNRPWTAGPSTDEEG